MFKNYKPISLLNVYICFESEKISVGRLALQDSEIYFEYDSSFLSRNLDISPFNLSLKAGLQKFKRTLFDGLVGVFNDSLPDGWGRLLIDRSLRSSGIDINAFSVLDRLAYVGKNAMGALIYEPDISEHAMETVIDLDRLSEESLEVLEGDSSIVFEELLDLNGSSAGARPKALIGVNSDKTKLIHGVSDLSKEFEHWLVKFPTTQDGIDAGAIEYVYSEMAKEAGIEMEETHLFSAEKGPGFFATRRFDRRGNNRLHMHTVSGLLHSNFRIPSLDYKDLLRLTMVLTKNAVDVEKVFRLAVFNVFSHNRDDHGKNFSFLMNRQGEWSFAPAYDLTFSSGPNGEQSTMVMGEGRNPSVNHLKELANIADIKQQKSNEIVEQVRESLSQWTALARDVGISKTNIKAINNILF